MLAGVLGVAILLGMTVIDHGSAQSANPAPVRLAPPAFRPSPAWITVTTGPTNPAVLAPQVWAITTTGNTSALRPFDLFNGLRALSKDGIVIWASTAGRGSPMRPFTASRWPLRLPSFRLDRSWEGQPSARVQQRLRWAYVRRWHLDVRVYFGTQRPSKNLLRIAEAELDRMVLPQAG